MQVLIPSALQSYTKAARVEATGGSLHELFDDLEARYAGLRFRVVDEQGRLRANMRVFVNGVDTRDLSQPLRPADFVAIVLALSGG